MGKTITIVKLEKDASSALDSFSVLFMEPSGNGTRMRESDNGAFLEMLNGALSLIKNSCEPDAARAAAFINAIAEKAKSSEKFSELLESCILEVLVAKDLFSSEEKEASEELAFFAEHAAKLLEICSHLFIDYAEITQKKSKGLPLLSPAASKLRTNPLQFKLRKGKLAPATLEKLKERALELDPFRTGRAFRFIDGAFIPVTLASIRPASKFYGYPEARRKFREFFESFSKDKNNLPLLISSLPGLGKTHFTIAHALSFENITLILPEPESLEKPLENLLARLASRKNRRFVIFFDDVNISSIDWYYFRTNVGGSFALPPNISIVIAANHRFPANITSRGRSFEFPIFDEVRCQEMVRDFLISLGMRNPNADLISVIAADYVECFGQKAFDELSPRTLVRYLEKYEKDAALRKRTLDLSKEEVISKPDSQIFLETNVKILRALYGEEAIEELRKQQLGES